MSDFPTFNQQDYNVELGTGVGISITMDGCAETCLTADCDHFGKNTTPDALNQSLISVNGYADNGAGQHDLLEWGAINQIYSDIKLAFNNSYPSTPADMGLIDSRLSKNLPVIVGVSFAHNPKDTQASHYVIIYKKNSDGSYNCMDPWVGQCINYDAKYAVNGMSVAQSILQAISYDGPIQVSNSPSTSSTIVFPDPHYTQEQAVIDAYQALCGALPNDDELKFRADELSKGKNMVNVIKELTGDGRYTTIYIDPLIDPLKAQIISLNSQVADLTSVNKQQADMLIDYQKQPAPITTVADTTNTTSNTAVSPENTPKTDTTTQVDTTALGESILTKISNFFKKLGKK